MPLRKVKDTAGGRTPRALHDQTSYHSNIGDEYLDALQRQVDATKPKGFFLTPLSEPGW